MEVFQTILTLVICSFYTTSAKSVAGFKLYPGKGNLSSGVSDANAGRMARDEVLGNELLQRTLSSASMKVHTVLAGRRGSQLLDFLQKRRLGKRLQIRNNRQIANDYTIGRPGAISVRRIGGTIDLFLLQPHALRYIAPTNMVRIDDRLKEGPFKSLGTSQSYERRETDDEQHNSIEMPREQGASNMYAQGNSCCAVGLHNVCCPSTKHRGKINFKRNAFTPAFSQDCCIGSNYKMCCPSNRRYMNGVDSTYHSTPKHDIGNELLHMSPPGTIVRKLLQESSQQTGKRNEAYHGTWQVFGGHPTAYSKAEPPLSNKELSNVFEQLAPSAGRPDDKYTSHNASSSTTYGTSNTKENVSPVRKVYNPDHRSAFPGSVGLAEDPAPVAVSGWPMGTNPMGKNHIYNAKKLYCDKLYRRTTEPTQSNSERFGENSINDNAYSSYLMGDPAQRIFPYHPDDPHIYSGDNEMEDKWRNSAVRRSHEGYVNCIHSLTTHSSDISDQRQYTVYPIQHTPSTSTSVRPCPSVFGCKGSNALTSSVIERPPIVRNLIHTTSRNPYVRQFKTITDKNGENYISTMPYLYKNVPLRSPLFRQKISYGLSHPQGSVTAVRVVNTTQTVNKPKNKSRTITKHREHIKKIHRHHHKRKHYRVKLRRKNRPLKVKYIHRKYSKSMRRRKRGKRKHSGRSENMKTFHVNKTKSDGERDLMQDNAVRFRKIVILNIETYPTNNKLQRTNENSVPELANQPQKQNPKHFKELQRLKKADKRKRYKHNDNRQKKMRTKNKNGSNSGRRRKIYYIKIGKRKRKVLLRRTKYKRSHKRRK